MSFLGRMEERHKSSSTRTSKRMQQGARLRWLAFTLHERRSPRFPTVLRGSISLPCPASLRPPFRARETGGGSLPIFGLLGLRCPAFGLPIRFEPGPGRDGTMQGRLRGVGPVNGFQEFAHRQHSAIGGVEIAEDRSAGAWDALVAICQRPARLIDSKQDVGPQLR